MNSLPAERMRLYAQLAYASVVLATFVQLAFTDRLEGPPWRLVVTFVLGALFFALATFCDDLTEARPPWRLHAYFVVQTVVVIGLIVFSPARGFFAIIALPLVSHAIFDLHWRGTLALILVVFGTTLALWWPQFGWPGVLRAAISFAPGYIFTIGFTLISREAIESRRKAETLSDELSAANAQLRQHAAEAGELATTRERNRLAREIHDGVGHYLTVIKVQLDAAHALLPTDAGRAADSLHKAARLAGEALDDVRRSVGTLGADARPPLTEALHLLAADHAPRPRLEIAGTPRPLPPPVEHALFRAAQEGLTNVRKHSAATKVALTLDYRAADCVRLSLLDNGRGDHGTAPQGPNGSGYGLRGLRERIALLGGTVSAGNRPEGGFELTAEVPA